MKQTSIQKFRQENRRIDYYPTDLAQAAIDRCSKLFPELSMREAIDLLVTKGIHAFPEASTLPANQP